MYAMENAKPRRRKRSRFGSTASVNSQPSTESNDTGAPSEPLSSTTEKPITLTTGKYKSAVRRNRIVTASLLSNGGPPDAPATFFSRDDDDSDDSAPFGHPAQTRYKPGLPFVPPPQSSLSPAAAPAPANDDVDGEVDPLDSFMQNLDYSAPPSKRARTALPVDDEQPESPSLSDPLSSKSNQKNSRSKRVYEKVDHATVNYPHFEKHLYIEVPELSNMTHAQVASLRRSLDNIRVRGRACPRPITSWSQCGLSSALLTVLKRCEYTTPTPIQAQGIPAVMSGRDVIGIARTGSGKTLAFILPLLRHIARRRRAAAGEGPGALVIAPTRELAIQIYGDANKFAKPLSVHCVCAYGGSALKDQIAELKRGADVVICTPGRMIDLLSMNSGRICNLRRVTFVVLDEADRMFDMGFEPQLTRIVENIRPDRQTVMFSATFPSQVEKLARKILKQPLEITIGGNSVAAATIDQNVEVRSEESKFYRLLELLGTWYDVGSTLVFVDRQDNADRIFRDLSKARYKCLSLHGGMDQADRDSTIVDFKNGDVKVLVATSVAARGLDVKNLTLVVNYDVPSHYEDYVHRVGRTGRAGKSGTSYTFITPEQDSFASDLVKALELSARFIAEQEAPIGDKEAAKKAGDEAASEAVPEVLHKMANTFDLKRKAGIVKYAGGSGYGGRGFKFDENEEYNATKTAIRKMQAKQYGMEDDVAGEDDDSDGGGGDEDKKIVTEKKKLGYSKREEGMGKPPLMPPVGGHGTKVALSERQVNSLLEEAVRKAEALADTQRVDEGKRRLLIAQAKAQVLSLATMQHGQGSGVAGGSAIEGGLVTTGDGDNENDMNDDGKGKEGASRFSDELEINDYPQHARWQVTRKGSLNDVEEFTGCVVTTRGNFYPAGRNPPAGERKLHLLIEGANRHAVETAHRDIQQKLEEAASVSRPGDNQYSKYSVV